MCSNCKRKGFNSCQYLEEIRRRGPGKKKIEAGRVRALAAERAQDISQPVLPGYEPMDQAMARALDPEREQPNWLAER